MSDDKVSISISRSLYEKVKSKVKESRSKFNSVEEYIESVLGKVVSEEQETITVGPEEEEKITVGPEEEEKIKDRLRRLGYL